MPSGWRSPQARHIRVVVYPLSGNPYQSLLYRHLNRTSNCSLRFISSPSSLIGFLFHFPLLLILLIAYRIRGYNLVHLHWIYAIRFPGHSIAPKVSDAVSSAEVYVFLATLQLLHFTLIWTVHDLIQHNRQTTSESKLVQAILTQSKELILLSSTTETAMSKLDYSYDQKHVTIIPLGNYVGYYQNHTSKQTARDALGIPQDAFVFLFFGIIDYYKNVFGLVDAFDVISKEYPSAYLVIAGKPHNRNLETEIMGGKAVRNKRILTNLDHVPDDEVQIYFNASDIAVYPFLEITNSSSVLLSGSFKKAVIAPRLGALRELPDGVGFFYDASAGDALADTMRQAIADRELVLQKCSQMWSFVASLDWDEIARDTMTVYQKALTERRGKARS